MNKENIVSTILEVNKYDKLNPMQKEAIKYIGQNTLVSSPTASGKTTVFEAYLLDVVLNKHKRVVYISPLKALTFEHYSETKRKFANKFNMRIGISTGDLDISVKNLDDYDVLFLTYEKFDSIFRHNVKWLKEIGLVTIDEIHEIGGDRGATLEILITQIKKYSKNIKILGLSATIGNSKELGKWLSSNLVISNYRPVPLDIGIYFDGYLHFEDRKVNINNNNKKGIGNIIIDTLKKEKQMIVFCNSRRNTMSLANKYSNMTNKYINEKEKLKLRKIAKEIGEIIEPPTKQCLSLYSCVSNGVAFHHAGLLYKQRELIEGEFRKKNIKIIFATPTLSAGINLPAFRVIINSVYRFSDGRMVPIGINEFHQMSGRAGRPKFDKSGEAIVIVNKENDISKMYNSYVIAEPTDIESQLSKINLMRMHLLSIILINNFSSLEEVLKYMSNTFYYFIFGNDKVIEKNIVEIIKEFKEFNFLEEINNKLKVTEVGKKICYLYLDPLSAYNIIQDIDIKKNKKIKDIELIFTLINTTEMKPYIRYKIKNEEEVFNLFENMKQNIYFNYEDLNLLKKIYESKLLNDWINEVPENEIIEKYNSSSGQIQNINNRIIWISHCVLELIKFTDCDSNTIKKYRELSIRLKYGVKKELLELVQLKNIGRIRARKLFINNIKSVIDIKKDPEKFISIVGKYGMGSLKELKIEYNSEVIKKESKEKTIVQKKLF